MIMACNAIRMVIRLPVKYLHDTVVLVHYCREVSEAAGGAFGRAEQLQPHLGIICKCSSYLGDEGQGVGFVRLYV